MSLRYRLVIIWCFTWFMMLDNSLNPLLVPYFMIPQIRLIVPIRSFQIILNISKSLAHTELPPPTIKLGDPLVGLYHADFCIVVSSAFFLSFTVGGPSS